MSLIESVSILMSTMLIFFSPFILMIILNFAKDNFKDSVYLTGIFLFTYIFLTLIGIFIYYLVTDLTLQSSTSTRTDIIYISTACAALMGSIIIIWGFNAWKTQHNALVIKEQCIKTMQDIEDLKNVFYLAYEELLQLEKDVMNNLIKIDTTPSEQTRKELSLINLEEYKKQLKFRIHDRPFEITNYKNKTMSNLIILSNILKDKTYMNISTDIEVKIINATKVINRVLDESMKDNFITNKDVKEFFTHTNTLVKYSLEIHELLTDLFIQK